jgi:hypothetical protein
VTADQALQDAIKPYILHDAWLAVMEYAAARRDELDEALRFQDVSERKADFYRGQASIMTNLLALQQKLMNPEPDHGD